MRQKTYKKCFAHRWINLLPILGDQRKRWSWTAMNLSSFSHFRHPASGPVTLWSTVIFLIHHHAWIVASSGSTFHRNYLWLSLRIMIIMIFLIIIMNTCRRVYDARTSQSVGQRLSQTNLLSMFGNTRVRRIDKQTNKKGNKQTKWGSNPIFQERVEYVHMKGLGDKVLDHQIFLSSSISIRVTWLHDEQHLIVQ